MQSILIGVAALACPVGMGVMMWMMGKGMMGARKDRSTQGAGSVEGLRREQARIAAELDRLEDAPSTARGDLIRG